ncbi:fibronectin type III [Agromyces rhizosphaerae]|uniref:Fibronectin type III n=1 Tax=Agromyces rhizosphaerae TaxID=88374 RepID=A0A9W6FN23_9MICO|nr:Ig-like domain-containing protein [Agromyces rhizosphaerae]GLI25965.1 fibronectin type III [Agromyces rhizosphaerae]
MIVEWLRAHRSGVLTAAATTMTAALIAGVAIASGGYTSQRVDLGDASVWVANGGIESVGRLNTAVRELDTAVETGVAAPVLVQRGATVLVVDPERANLDVLDPATATISESVAIPPVRPAVALAGDRVVIASDGDVWSTPIDDFAEFDSQRDPDLTFGAGTVTAADEDGTMVAFTPSTARVSRFDAADGTAVERTWQVGGEIAADAEWSITTVGGRWALLDATAEVLHLEGGSVELGDLVGPGGGVVLQEPATDGDAVLVAHRSGLLAVPFDAGTPEVLAGDRFGVPAAPVVADDCAYAAWADASGWSSCDTADAILEGGATGELAFRSNGSALVLNDAASGRSWSVRDGWALVDDWDALLRVETDERVVEQNDPSSPPTLERVQVPPVAVDDEFGARPQRTTILPVLLNDYDANGDVLAISSVGTAPEGVEVDLVSNDQQLQVTLPAGATGTVALDYTIDDGRGGSASAVVRIVARADDENGPPVQARGASAVVEAGGRVSTDVLADWYDPDGDPFYLADAAAGPPDTATYTAGGEVVFTERGGRGPLRTVALSVSDGRAIGAGTLQVAVRAAGSVPLVAEPFAVLASAGEERTISPLQHVSGGSGTPRLTAVPAKPDVVLVPDFDQGTFRFTSDAVGTHYLEYTVTDGDQTAVGVVRVDVAAPPDADTTPVTVPHTAFLRVRQTVDVDVLATDIDPTGGVLVITGADDTADERGMRVEVIEHRVLRVTLNDPLVDGAAEFEYTVSNGRAEATGTVRVVEIPALERVQAPVAADDTASVRVGDVIDIPVLANDRHPDDEPISLAPDLVEPPAEADGLLFASGDVLRFLAPSRPGIVSAVYRVEGPDGQFATATVRISVNDVDADDNSAPVPRVVTSRVLAGETVRIRIPLLGIDPDGDSVQLIGQETPPERGIVVRTGVDWIEYEAGEYSAGTDVFRYAVVDALGARATGTVRVGIAPRLDGVRAPVAVEDEVHARPGGEVAVRVLDNDSDPDGGPLTIVAVEPVEGSAEASVDGDLVRIAVPRVEGRSSFIYTIRNEGQATASAFLVVDVSAEAPLARPEAGDTVLSLSDILDRSWVDVDVRENVFFADGPAERLGVELVPGWESGAVVRGDGTIRVTLADERQVIPFRVVHPDDPELDAYAFVRVPGYEDALPQLRLDAPPIIVQSEQEVLIEINEHVVAVGGRPVRITDEATVRASNGDGGELVVDADTLRFRSADEYFGPASVSFVVTDGASADDPDARTATIVLPITVLPRENQPPSFTGGLIEFEPGQQREIDLLKLTSYPYPADLDELAFRLVQPLPDGFDLSLDGTVLRVTTAAGTLAGTRAAVTVAVQDDSGDGRAGRIELRVVPSTRPLAVPAPDSAVARRGSTTTVDVLANDAATNPFPDVPLRVVRVRGADDASLPSGVHVVPSADRTSLRVTVDEGAEPVNSTIQYQVADATGDAGRYAWGVVTISVQDRPEPVAEVRATGFGDRSISIDFSPGPANNSPITAYEVTLRAPGSGEVLAVHSCPATDCTVPTLGNGRANQVAVEVRARNGIGLSDAARPPETIWSDVVPGAPADLRAAPLDGGLRVTWTPVVPAGGGTPVTRYVVIVAGQIGEVSAASICSATACVLDRTGLVNGSSVPVAISPRNDAYPALSTWREASVTGTPFGAPRAGTADAIGDASAGAVTVTWSAFDPNGDAIRGYFVQRLAVGSRTLPTGPQACSVSTPAPGTVSPPTNGAGVEETRTLGPDARSARFEGLSAENTEYAFVVWGYNRAGCASSAVLVVTPRPFDRVIDEVRGEMRWTGDGLAWDYRVTSVTPRASRYEIVAVDAAGVQLAGTVQSFGGTGWPREILGRPFGEAVRFQLRACAPWGSCGPWSPVQPADPEPSLDFALPSLRWDAPASRWTWTNPPDNGALEATFRCGTGPGPGSPAGAETSCVVGGGGPGGTAWLDVTVGGITKRYESD